MISQDQIRPSLGCLLLATKVTTTQNVPSSFLLSNTAKQEVTLPGDGESE